MPQSIDIQYYKDIDFICRVLFEKELNLDPLDTRTVIRKLNELIDNKRAQLTFWNKLRTRIININKDNITWSGRTLAFQFFISDHIKGVMDSLPESLPKEYISEITNIDLVNTNILNFDICFNCKNKELKTRICGNCDLVRYCSEKCQREDWVKSHKSICKLLPLYLE